MEDTKKEVMIEKYPRPISIQDMKKILNQMENNICKIYKEDGGKGTGFFCNIIYKNKKIPVMITNNHVIDEKYINKNKIIKYSISDDIEIKNIKKNKERMVYTNEEYDTTIIEIKEKDEIKNFMEIDEDIFINNSDILYNNKSIYIIQYPLSDKVKVSYGIINNINEYSIEHYCCTESGSSGSPIINLLI
jgi:V8-like Glu-specific endopeptidase